jgi:hypothetical protein
MLLMEERAGERRAFALGWAEKPNKNIFYISDR